MHEIEEIRGGTMENLNEYTIIQEGEAEILMYAENEVLYNKTQVNNRDISIAVLRSFISKRKQEHKAMMSKRTSSAPKVSEKDAVEDSPDESVLNDEYSNGEIERAEEISQGEPCCISEAAVKTIGRKVPGKLKPQRVLEALSASGLRALRYAREIEGISQVVALDNDKVQNEHILAQDD